ncbi:hypothetical protein BMS3Bbin02_02351 [bacterium BMS3Bbin02]|nr:hypothetical protein BMS3Bbin02_02351 [bacterium BMS3Bbin02]
MPTRTLRFFSATIASWLSGRTMSDIAIAPTGMVPSITYTTDSPRPPAAVAKSASAGGTTTSRLSRSLGPPTKTSVPSMVARTPRPLRASNDCGSGTARLRPSADSRIARAMGCSESPSTAAASARTRSSVTPSTVSISATPICPVVNVPVLSNTTTLRSLAVSIASR